MGGAALARVVGWELKDQKEPLGKATLSARGGCERGILFLCKDPLGPPAQCISTPPPLGAWGSLQHCWLSCAHLTHEPFLEFRCGLSREPQILQPALAQHPLPGRLSGLL